MGKLVVTEFVTLDGVMEDPGGGEKDKFDRGGWAFRFERGEEGEDAADMTSLILVETRQTGSVAILTFRRDR